MLYQVCYTKKWHRHHVWNYWHVIVIYEPAECEGVLLRLQTFIIGLNDSLLMVAYLLLRLMYFGRLALRKMMLNICGNLISLQLICWWTCQLQTLDSGDTKDSVLRQYESVGMGKLTLVLRSNIIPKCLGIILGYMHIWRWRNCVLSKRRHSVTHLQSVVWRKKETLYLRDQNLLNTILKSRSGYQHVNLTSSW